MAFTRFSTLVAFLYAASHLANASLQERHPSSGAHAALKKRYTCPTGQVTSQSKCCSLYPVVQLMQKELFDGGECNEEARSALRLSFHDAIGWSSKGGLGGGADGSILAFNKTEQRYSANGGVDDITAIQYPVFVQSGLSAGDFVHLAAAVGTANCAGAPRLKFMYGRPAPKAAAPDNTVPEPTDSVTKILARFADAGFSPRESVALLASHSIAAANDLDPKHPGLPLDSTIQTFDTQFYLEVMLKAKASKSKLPSSEMAPPLVGEIRIKSDWLMSQDQRTACYWQQMINDQTRMQGEFKDAMAKLQVLGQDTTKLTDCSEVIPSPATFTADIKYPASFSKKDLDIACAQISIPTLKTVSGPAPTVAAARS